MLIRFVPKECAQDRQLSFLPKIPVLNFRNFQHWIEQHFLEFREKGTTLQGIHELRFSETSYQEFHSIWLWLNGTLFENSKISRFSGNFPGKFWHNLYLFQLNFQSFWLACKRKSRFHLALHHIQFANEWFSMTSDLYYMYRRSSI